MIEILTLIFAIGSFLLMLWLVLRSTQKTDVASALLPPLEDKHRAMLRDLHDGLNKLGDRLNVISTDNSDRLRASVAQELKETRDAMQALQLTQTQNLAA